MFIHCLWCSYPAMNDLPERPTESDQDLIPEASPAQLTAHSSGIEVRKKKMSSARPGQNMMWKNGLPNWPRNLN